MEFFISTLVGIPIGILSSLLAWWILFHKLVPKISFSTALSKTITDDRPSGSRYRIKIGNDGRRKIIDMEIFARLSVTGLRGNEAQDTKTIYNIKVGNTRIPSLWPGNNTVIRLYPEDSESFADAAFPEHLREKISLRTLTLEDLLELGRQSQLRIVIFGYDSFSGSRKIFESKLYDKTSIKTGMFFSDSLDVDVGNLISIRSSDGLTRA